MQPVCLTIRDFPYDPTHKKVAPLLSPVARRVQVVGGCNAEKNFYSEFMTAGKPARAPH